MEKGVNLSIRNLYEQYNRRLVNFLRGKLSKNEDPQDFAHDVFVRLIEIGELPEGKHLENLIFKIARAKVIDEYRKKNVRKIFAQEEYKEENQIDEKPIQDKIMESRQEWDRFKECLSLLPPRCREVFLLQRFHNYSQKEIAAKLGISISAIEKNMIRAVKKLNVGFKRKP